jgi:cell division protein FtsW
MISSIHSRTKGDKVIWAIVVLLTMMSLLVVYSSTGTLAYKLSKSTESYLFKQIVFIAIGVMIIYFAHKVNYTIYSRVALFIFLASIPLLVYTLIFGASLNEANRWIKLPIINLTFQTSDLAKLALFMYLGRQLSRKQDVIKDFRKGFLPLIIPVGIICILIAPANLSTALLVGATSLLLMFIGRVSIKHIGLVIVAMAIPVMILIGIATAYYDKQEKKSKDLPAMFNRGRVETWIKRVQSFMYAGREETGYQVQQAKIAIAKGGWVGLGPGNSEQRNFLPHPYSDFIYAIIIEEYGLVGGMFVLFIYLAFLFRCIRIFKRCPYAFGAFLALGLSFTLVIQAMANMAVNVSLFPVTGVTLPLVSMGGSSFLFTCLAIGIILSVARNVEQMEAPLVPAFVNGIEEEETVEYDEEEESQENRS